MAGVALGTPAYMAPEQIDGNDLDARVDVYSLGLVAWEMLTGRRAWLAKDCTTILYHQKHELPPDVRELRDDVPDRLAEVIARAIEKKRDARWGSMGEMLHALDESTPLVLAPRRVSHGDETMRFVRTSLPASAPAPVFALEPMEEEIPAIEVHRRRLPVVGKRTATVVATLSLAAMAAALVRTRPPVAPPAPAPHATLPLLQGDVRKPVTLPAPLDTHVMRHETPRVAAAAPVPTPKPAKPAAPAVDSMPQPTFTIPTLGAKPRLANISIAATRIPTGDSSASSVWRGPTPLKLGGEHRHGRHPQLSRECRRQSHVLGQQ